MIIYKRTNTLDKKVYIGQCIREGEDPRWPECILLAKTGKGGRLGKAIRESGPQVFKKENIYKAKTQHELDMMETFFIVLYQSRDPRYGYNQTPGGDGGGVFRTGRAFNRGMTDTEYFGEEKAKEKSKKLSEIGLGKKKGVWITNGIINRVIEDPIPEGWRPGRVQKKPKLRGPDPPEKIAKRVASTIATWKKKRAGGLPLCSPEEAARLKQMSKMAAEIRWSRIQKGSSKLALLPPVSGRTDTSTSK